MEVFLDADFFFSPFSTNTSYSSAVVIRRSKEPIYPRCPFTLAALTCKWSRRMAPSRRFVERQSPVYRAARPVSRIWFTRDITFRHRQAFGARVVIVAP